MSELKKQEELLMRELLDRTVCIQLMFDQLIEGHPAITPQIEKYVIEASDALHSLYQEIGKIHLK